MSLPKGFKHSEETKKKIGKASKQLWLDPIFKEKMSAKKRGKSNSMYGRTQSEETKEKIRQKAIERMKDKSRREHLSKINKGKKHTKESKKKISMAQIGKKHTKESKEKMSLSHKGKIISLETRAKMSKARKGKKMSKETKIKMSQALKQKWKDPIYRNKAINSHQGRVCSEETKRKLSIAKSGKNHPMYGKKTSKETKKKLSAKLSGKNNPMYGKTPWKGRKHSEETKSKMSQSAKKIWNDPERRKKGLQQIIRALKCQNRSPNKVEKQLNQLLQKLFPNKYQFVGNWKIIIDGFCPDFIDKKSKKIIELYGDYWHNLPKRIDCDKRRVISYTNHGYELLIVWEHELKNIKTLKKKLINFITNKKISIN